MKTFQLILLSVFLFGVHTIAQSQTIESEYYGTTTAYSNVPETIVDIVTHDVTLPQFVYDHRLPLSSDERMELNLPFAHNFNISGDHLSFTVDKEDFDYYFYRNHKEDGYYDLQVSIYRKSYNVISSMAIIRIIFK